MTERFRLLPAEGLALFEYITVGVIVKELVPSLLAVLAVEEIDVETKLILTGDFGRRGTNELAVTVEVFDNFCFGRDSVAVVFRLVTLSLR